MSLGEAPPKIMGRFTSPNMSNKKYSGTTKSPMLNSPNSGNRNSQARQRLLASKISAPRPINLPSLRRENAGGVEIVSSPGSSHGWGSPSASPSFNRSDIKSTESNTNHSSSPSINSPAASTPIPNVWANSSILTSKLKSTTKEPEPESELNIEPAIEEPKDFLKYTLSDLNHQSWDEMVSEDLDDFSVNVIEFDDGTKVPIDDDPKPTKEEAHVQADTPVPLKPFTGNGPKSYHRDNSRHHSTDKWHRRDSSDNKRANYERKSDSYHPPINGPFHPTPPLEQHRRSSEHSFKSNHSREDTEKQLHNTLEQNNTVPKRTALSAVEQAKKRRDEQEAEYKAAAERARQKAAALAAEAQKKGNEQTKDDVMLREESEPSSVSSTTSKAWNLVAAKSSETGLSSIEQNNTSDTLEEQVEKLNLSNITAKHRKSVEKIVEIVDFSENEEWGTIPDQIVNGRHRERGWVKHDEEVSARNSVRGGISATGRGRGRGSISTSNWRQPEEPVIVEILKHEPVKEEPKEVVLSYREKIDNLLKDSASPLLPEFAAKMLTKKPAKLCFMVDIEEEDAEITAVYTEPAVQEDEIEHNREVADPVGEIESTPSSGTSTPSYYNSQQNEVLGNGVDLNRMNMNSNYPMLVYQYPIAQPSTSDDTRHSGYHTQPAPMNVYFMPQQQYMANNQYMLPYPQAGSGNVQPMYYPTVSWQQPHYSNQPYSPRPHYKPRRNFHNTKYNHNEWQPRNSYQSRPYRGRGGFHSYNKRYYQPQEQTFDVPPSAPLEDEE